MYPLFKVLNAHRFPIPRQALIWVTLICVICAIISLVVLWLLFMDPTPNRALYSLLLPHLVYSPSYIFSGVFILDLKHLPSHPHTFKSCRGFNTRYSHTTSLGLFLSTPQDPSFLWTHSLFLAYFLLPITLSWLQHSALRAQMCPTHPQCLKGSRCSTKERRLMTCSYCPPLIISLSQQFQGSGMSQTLQGPKNPLLHTWSVG